MSHLPLYFDNNASTRPYASVIEAMADVMRSNYANPSSTDHAAGAAAAALVESSREAIAASLGARPSEIIFTSGATEANNLAIRGTYFACASPQKSVIVTAATEHPSVLQTLEALRPFGCSPLILSVNCEGRVDLAELREVISDKVCLVTLMGANNETGVCHPLRDIGAICRDKGVPFHSDLTQLAPWRELDMNGLGISLASLSAHKMHGPKGVGLLFARGRRPRAKLEPVQSGGGQERAQRSGTLNTEGVIGMAAAFAERRTRLAEVGRISELRTRLEQELLAIGGVEINGGEAERAPHTLNLSIAGVDPHALQHATRRELVFSTSSACSTEKVANSTVLEAMFGDTERTRNGFRLGLSHETTLEDVLFAARSIATATEHLRSGSIGTIVATDLVE